MKKQGKVYTSIILGIFLVAVLCYFGYAVFGALHDPLTTMVAMEYEAGLGSYTVGFVVRDEHLINSRYSITNLLISEGERVATGQALATGYVDDAARERQDRITELEQELKQLRYADSYSGDAADRAVLDGEIQNQLINLTQLVARRDMNSAAELSPALKGLILRRTISEDGGDALKATIEELEQELERLQNTASSGTTTVRADRSGYFSGTVDGLENVLTVESLETITVARLEELAARETEARQVGKLILGDQWYYVTTVPSGQLKDVSVGDKVPVSFATQFFDELTMTVSRIGSEEDGQRVLVLTCDRYMQEVTLLRQQSAEIVFSSYTGLRVPKQAIRVKDTQAGVYVVEGRAAAWKNVKILHDNGESYVVALDKSSTDNLWPGDEIILGGRGLYEGKVVQ